MKLPKLTNLKSLSNPTTIVIGIGVLAVIVIGTGLILRAKHVQAPFISSKSPSSQNTSNTNPGANNGAQKPKTSTTNQINKIALGSKPYSLPTTKRPVSISLFAGCNLSARNAAQKAFVDALKAENTTNNAAKPTDKAAKDAEIKRHQAAIISITANYQAKLKAIKCR